MQKEKLKVLIVQPWISYRGAETVSVLEAFYLNKLGFGAKIACLFVDWERLPPKGSEVEYILPPRFLSTLFAKSKLFLLVFGFPTLLFLVFNQSRKFDILNPHNLPSTWVCSIVSQSGKVKCVWTAHGLPESSNQFGGFFTRVVWFLGIKSLDKWAVRKMKNIISVSRKVASEVEDYYGVKSKVLYPPTESSFYQAGDGWSLRKKLGFGKQDFLILYLARLHPAKQPLLALKAFELVSTKISKVRLLIAGEGVLEDSLKSRVQRKKLENKVAFSGFVNPKEVKNYYAAADLVIIPYRQTEGCPLTPLEALSPGTVSIVSKGSGVDEIIEKEKVGLVSTPTSRGFAEKIAWSYFHPEEVKLMGEKGEKFVEKNFSGEIYARRLVELL